MNTLIEISCDQKTFSCIHSLFFFCQIIILTPSGLGQQRIMPSGIHSQEKACKQEERLLAKINTIELDSTLLTVLQKETRLLLEGMLCILF